MIKPSRREIKSALARYAGLVCRNLREDAQRRPIFHRTAVDPQDRERGVGRALVGPAAGKMSASVPSGLCAPVMRTTTARECHGAKTFRQAGQPAGECAPPCAQGAGSAPRRWRSGLNSREPAPSRKRRGQWLLGLASTLHQSCRTPSVRGISPSQKPARSCGPLKVLR
jgi:hypothetical protein